MDLETTISILEVQLADTRELLADRREGTTEWTDYERALLLQYDELRATLRTFTDLQMSQSMSGAMPDNPPVNVSSSFVRDYEGIPRIDGAIPNDDGSSIEDDSDTGMSIDKDDRSAIDDDADTEMSTDNDDRASIDHDADTDIASEASSHQVFGQCVACIDRFPASQGYTAPCDHIYCSDCTVRLFEDSLRDESLFPPRCCRQEMVIDSVQAILGAALTQRFNLKAIEHATADKTYCYKPRCSTFILPDNIHGRRGLCTECRRRTCVNCKQKAHKGRCEEPEDAVFEALTEEQGWRVCHRCRAVVELSTGCNHITW